MGKIVMNGTRSRVVVVQFPASGWTTTSPYTQTVSNTRIAGVECPLWDIYNPTTEGEVESFGYVSSMETGVGSVTLRCISDKPDSTFSIQIKE